jgi:TfoX/Sxy family transcriptional regulator of competence genes
MATQLNTILYILDQLEDGSNIRYKKMFGEYCLYISPKCNVFVCDDLLYVPKLSILDSYNLEKGFPYQGAKEKAIVNYEDKEQLNEIIRLLQTS